MIKIDETEVAFPKRRCPQCGCVLVKTDYDEWHEDPMYCPKCNTLYNSEEVLQTAWLQAIYLRLCEMD